MPKDPTIEEAKAHKRAHGEGRYQGPAMTLGNMRENGVRSIVAWCQGIGCEHEMVINVDHLPAELAVPAIGPRLRCSVCGHLGADARPNWNELAAGSAQKA